MNLAILIGHLGADPEVRNAGEKRVCSFGIATTHKYKDDKGQEVEQTTWHRIQVWGNMGKACADHLTKGRQVCVRGRIRHSVWEGKDGNKKKGSEIVAEHVQFLGAKPKKKGEDDDGDASW